MDFVSNLTASAKTLLSISVLHDLFHLPANEPTKKITAYFLLLFTFIQHSLEQKYLTFFKMGNFFIYENRRSL